MFATEIRKGIEGRVKQKKGAVERAQELAVKSENQNLILQLHVVEGASAPASSSGLCGLALVCLHTHK